MGIIEAKQRLQELQIRKKKEAERQNEILKLPYHKQLQEPENKFRLERMENIQEESFRIIIKRRHPELLNEVDELFADYFLGFLAGKFKSINEYLYGEDKDAQLRRVVRKEIRGWKDDGLC